MTGYWTMLLCNLHTAAGVTAIAAGAALAVSAFAAVGSFDINDDQTEEDKAKWWRRFNRLLAVLLVSEAVLVATPSRPETEQPGQCQCQCALEEISAGFPQNQSKTT